MKLQYGTHPCEICSKPVRLRLDQIKNIGKGAVKGAICSDRCGKILNQDPAECNKPHWRYPELCAYKVGHKGRHRIVHRDETGTAVCYYEAK